MFGVLSSRSFFSVWAFFLFCLPHIALGQSSSQLTTYPAKQTNPDANGAVLKYLPSTMTECLDTSGTTCEGKWFTTAAQDGFGTMGKGTTAVFTFKGSYIEVYGHKLDSGARGTYTIDSDAPIDFTSNKPNQTNVNEKSTDLLFSYSNLDPEKEHTVEIAYNDADFGKAGGPRKFLSIVSIQYMGENNASTSSSSTTASTINVGAIVGGIVGGLVGLGLLCFVAFWYWRRWYWRRENSFTPFSEAGHSSNGSVAPQRGYIDESTFVTVRQSASSNSSRGPWFSLMPRFGWNPSPSSRKAEEMRNEQGYLKNSGAPPPAYSVV